MDLLTRRLDILFEGKSNNPPEGGIIRGRIISGIFHLYPSKHPATEKKQQQENRIYPFLDDAFKVHYE